MFIFYFRPFGSVLKRRFTYLGALDVIMQVITEGVDEIDGVVSGVGVGMTREQDWRG